MGINMNDGGSLFFSLQHIGKGYRVRLSHIASHNQNRIAIDQVLWK